MEYKFRAECKQDAISFLESNSGDISNFESRIIENGPDIEATFESNLPLDEIIQKMMKIEDGHVMAQTVLPTVEYTGERNFDIPKGYTIPFKIDAPQLPNNYNGE